MNRGIIRLYLVLMIAVVLSGCARKKEEPWIPEETAIQIDEQGVVTETIAETLDQDYYDAAELEKMIRSSLEEYAAAHGQGLAELQEFGGEPGKVLVRIKYASAQDYAAFNRAVLFNGSILNAQMNGFRFEENFYRVKGGSITGDQLPPDEPLSHKEYQVAISGGSHALEVPGKVVYVSANAQMIAPRVARPVSAGGQKEDEESGKALTYVIYE